MDARSELMNLQHKGRITLYVPRTRNAPVWRAMLHSHSAMFESRSAEGLLEQVQAKLGGTYATRF